MLSRKGGEPWKVETLFEDRDKGHSLAVAELDGRNATEELLGSGYGGRIFMLSRPVGYGRPGIPTDPDTLPSKAPEKKPMTVPGKGAGKRPDIVVPVRKLPAQ